MRANEKVLIWVYDVKFGLTMKQKAKFTANCAGSRYVALPFDDGCNARGRLTSALLWPINCICVALLYIKIYHH